MKSTLQHAAPLTATSGVTEVLEVGHSVRRIAPQSGRARYRCAALREDPCRHAHRRTGCMNIRGSTVRRKSRPASDLARGFRLRPAAVVGEASSRCTRDALPAAACRPLGIDCRVFDEFCRRYRSQRSIAIIAPADTPLRRCVAAASAGSTLELGRSPFGPITAGWGKREATPRSPAAGSAQCLTPSDRPLRDHRSALNCIDAFLMHHRLAGQPVFRSVPLSDESHPAQLAGVVRTQLERRQPRSTARLRSLLARHAFEDSSAPAGSLLATIAASRATAVPASDCCSHLARATVIRAADCERDLRGFANWFAWLDTAGTADRRAPRTACSRPGNRPRFGSPRASRQPAATRKRPWPRWCLLRARRGPRAHCGLPNRESAVAKTGVSKRLLRPFASRTRAGVLAARRQLVAAGKLSARHRWSEHPFTHLARLHSPNPKCSPQRSTALEDVTLFELFP